MRYINNCPRKGLTLIFVAELWTLGSFTMWGQVCTITPTYNDVICNGGYTGSINIFVTGGSEPYIFSWTGPGSFVSTSRNLTGLGAGSYTVTVIGNAGSCTGIETVTINQPVQPMTIITQPATQTDCYGNTVEFSIDITGNEGAVSYQWQSRPPGGIFTDIPGAHSSTVTIHDIGVNGQNIDGTEYRVIITDNCGSITSVPALLNINSISSLSGSVNLTICNGGNTAYEIHTHGSVAGYQWSFNNGTGWDPVADEGAFSGVTSSRLAISGATIFESGSYRISVTFNTLNQPDGYPYCVITSHTRTRNLTVLPPISLPVVSAAQSVCFDGVPDQLHASPSSGGSGSDYSYQWQNSNDGVSWTDIIGAQSLLFSPPSLTTTTWYRLAATDEGALACGTANSLPVVITVDPIPVALISVNGPTTFCEEGSVTLTSSLASSYLWSTGDTSREITISSSGSYSVSIADDCGNISTCTSVITLPAELSAMVTSTIDASCYGVNNGSIDITVSGGTEPYSFRWNNEAITEDLTVLPAGSYSVIVTDLNGCLATLSEIVIAQPEKMTPLFDSVGPYCFGAVIPDLPTSSTNAITGTWTPAINNIATTTYTFTPAAGECSTATTLEITVGARITLAIGATATTCPGGATGAINLIVSGGTAPYTFNWSNGASIQNLTDVVADTYTVTVTDANGCIAAGSAIVAEPPALITSTNVTNASSVGASDGSVNLTVTGGTTPYTFSWSNGAVSEDISGLSAGTYIVTITDANGCSTTATAIVTENASPSLSISKTVGQTNISTPTTLNYTITIRNTESVGLTAVTVTDPFAGSAAYSSGDTDGDNVLDPNETWTYTADYAATQADIDAGIDLVNIASAICNEVTTPVTAQAVTSISGSASLTVEKTQTSTVPITTAGQIITYRIVITNTGNISLSGGEATEIFPGAGAGVLSDPIESITENGILEPGETWTHTATYTVTQSDIDAGVALVNTVSVVTVEVPGPTVDQVITPVQGGASLRITKTATSASYSYVGDVLQYTIVVANTGNVTLTGVVVNDPNADVTCQGAPVTLAPGASETCTATHTVTAADVSTHSITNVATATGYDPGGSVVNASSNAVVVSLTNLAPSITCPPAIESGTDATICGAMITTGLGATYADPNGNVVSLTWIMTGATPANSPATGINNITSYTFNSGITIITYTVTDEFGLSETCNYTVTVTDTTIPDAVCNAIDVYLDANTGEASIVVDDIDGGSTDNCGIASMLINVTTFDCTNIGPNNVTLTVTDNSGNVGTCISVVTVHYAQPPDPEVNPAADVICNGETINLALTSNIPGTAWTWTANSLPEITGASGDNTGLISTITQTLNNSDRGAHNVIYTITPRVYGQCDLTPVSAEIWVNPTPMVQVTPVESVICYGETATLTVGNPNGPVRGMWQYDLTVVPDPDIRGNTASGTVTSPTNLNETLTNEGIENQKVVYTFTPRILPPDGGAVCTGPGQVITIWVHPRVHYTEDISNFNGYNISCYGKAKGFIDIVPSPDLAPYTFAWTGPNGFTAATEDISQLFAGEYILAITDVNNCTTTGTFVLDEPDQLNVAIEPSVSMDGGYNINCAGASTGSVRVTVNNSVGAVDYLWMDGGLGSTRTNLSAGDYKVIITDSNNCQAESSITLTEPEPIVLTFDIIDTFCPDSPDGAVRLDATGGVPGPGYSYLWSNNSTDKDIAGLKPGVYDVTVTDANLCVVTGSASVGSRREICLIISDAFSPNNDLVNDTWIIDNIGLYPEAEITIFNRWGQLIWNSQRGYPNPWDGRDVGGHSLPIDGYHYVIDLHNGFRMIVGDITIVR